MDRAQALDEHYREPDHRAALAADPERAALATAIAAHAEAAERLARIRAALDRAPVRWEATARLEAATAALAEARAAEDANTVARLLGDPVDPSPVPAAQAALSEAEAALATTRQQHDVLAEQQRAAERAVAWQAASLRSAVSAVLKAAPAVAALAEAFAAAQRRVIELHTALRAVSAAGGIPEQHRFWEALPGDGFFPDRLPSATAWRAAIAALAEDSNAVLPPGAP